MGKNIEPFKRILSEITPESLLDAAQNPSNLFAKLAATGKILPPNVKPEQVPQDVQLEITSNVIRTAFAAALWQDNRKIKAGLGEDLMFVHKTSEISPYSLFPKLAASEFNRNQWVEYCEENGLSGLRFG